MELHKQETLVVTLSQMLVGKQVKTQTIQNELLLICEGFGFDCAFVYEADQYNTQLYLKESYGSGLSVKTELDIESFYPRLYLRLAEGSMLYCHNKIPQTAEQEAVLSLLGVSSASVVSAVDENGHIYGILAVCNGEEKDSLDETAQKNLEAALSIISASTLIRVYHNRLHFFKTALENILDNTGIDIYVNDFNNHDILYVNQSMAKPYGGKNQFMERKCWQVLFPGQTGPCEFCPQKKLIDEEGNPTKVYTWDYQRAFDGSWFRVFSAAFYWVDGRLVHVVSSADITDNKRNEELIRYMANYDALTNLPNRRMLVADCGRYVSEGLTKTMYVLFFDIDGFKAINDNLGHDAGDEFLIKLGEFLTSIPLLKGSIYRNGGDEFVALLGEDLTENNIRDLAWFIHIKFQQPWLLKKGTAKCNTSIGVARYPEDGLTAEDLLCKADKAMYYVKKNGGGSIAFAYELE